ncbi:endolytic transglycosylase MltG [Marinicella sp. W31]|uniref:endolytic transglycosylase MltG n=1 Tax=Marinicella sp. W31 TaxID=3023713 RepID=UPI003758109A
MIRKLTLTLMVLMLLAIAAMAYIYQNYQQFLEKPVFSDLPVQLVIEKGESYQGFVNQVSRINGTDDWWQWKLLGRFQQGHQYIKAGEYEVSANMTPLELLQYIGSNKVKTYQVTLVEGMTWKEVRLLLQENAVLGNAIADMNDAEIAAKLDINQTNLEGQFLPETYQFRRGDSDFSILQRAHRALQDVLDKAWSARQSELQLQTPYELLILASIIEKETAQASERSVISGVFNRRLKLNMRLQTDPTVIYGIGADYAGDITRKHLKTDTPYNTYTRHGLPPTPIAMASTASIEAAAQPNDGNELYFVADGFGGHQFSETYEVHEKAVQAYLKILRQKKSGQ